MSRARKRFGQHFLEPAWVEKVMAAIAPQADETFLEIGPGRGALTIPLASRAKHVVACEIDRDLVTDLRRSNRPNVTIVEGDFLDLSADRVRREFAAANAAPTIRVAGNLPYNVASPILFKLVELFGNGIPFADATVMMQREVADRLTASPDTKEYGVLSILIGHAARVERLLALPPGAFRPAPQSSLGRRPIAISRPRSASPRPACVRGDGSGDLHPAEKDARERPRRVPAQRRPCSRQSTDRGGVGRPEATREHDHR